MPTTPRGLIYPDSGAHTRTWEHWQALAESADAALGAFFPPDREAFLWSLGIQRGTFSVAMSGSSVGGSFTFPRPYAAAPIVVLTLATSAANRLILTINPGGGGVTATTVFWACRTGDGTNNTSNPTGHYIAIGNPGSTALTQPLDGTTDTGADSGSDSASDSTSDSGSDASSDTSSESTS